jgi:hypothetical protein
MCGGPDVPRWYLDEPEDPDAVYAAHRATARQMQVALDSAMVQGRKDLATQIETTLADRTEAFSDTLDDESRQHFAQARMEAAHTLSENCSAKEKKVFQREGGILAVFILMDVPVKEAAQTLLSELEGHPHLYAAFQSSPAYRRMTVGTAQSIESALE